MHQQSGLVVKSTLFVGYVVYADCLQARSLPTRVTATTFHVHSCHNHTFTYLHICITIPFKLPTGATATISHVHSCHGHMFAYLRVCITFPFNRQWEIKVCWRQVREQSKLQAFLPTLSSHTVCRCACFAGIFYMHQGLPGVGVSKIPSTTARLKLMLAS